MENLLKGWKCRHLSLKGKITVINTLALSPLLHIANTVHVPQRVFSEVRKVISEFLWDGKPAKIFYDTLTQPIESGGLKLISRVGRRGPRAHPWWQNVNGTQRSLSLPGL